MFPICDALFILSILIIQLFDTRATKEHQPLLRKTTNTIESHRNLQQHFMQFQPTSDVVDYANTDLDLKEIKKDMLPQTVDGFNNAQEIYENGAYSGSYSILTLEEGVPRPLEKGEQISGFSADKKETSGKLRKAVKKGDTIIEVQYPTSNYCRVNGDSPSRRQCFAETGFLQANWAKTIIYSYNIEQDTKNGGTIQKLSTLTTKYDDSTTEGMADDYIIRFKDYYGRYDYADHWIMTAFNEGTTEFDNGNANFALYNEEGRAEVIQQAGTLLSVWMHVVLKLGEAIHICQMNENDDKQNSNKIDATDNNNDEDNKNKMTITEPWDEAVAFYFGSQENGRINSGHFPYGYANIVCKHFGTCGTIFFSQAESNMATTTNFVIGQQMLIDGNCEDAIEVRDTILRQMIIPLIQGTLHSAYTVGVQLNTREEIRAEGAVLAASVLPLIHSCSTEDANMIYTNMRVGAESTPDFVLVKAAFENNYDCLGIKCEDIGGIIDPNKSGQNSYLENAESCGIDQSNSDAVDSNTENYTTREEGKGMPIEVTIGISVGAVFVAALLLGLYEYFYGVRWY